MGQQRPLLALAVAVCSAVLLPLSAGADAGPARQASVAALLSSMNDPVVLQTTQTYQKLMGHKHSLSQGHLERSLVFTGSNLRLRRVLAELMQQNKKHFHTGVIGGSISWGHMVQRGTEDWFTLLQHWMTDTFPQHNITFRNGCVPATQSSYVSSCLQQFVESDVDLVFVEYVTNDGYHHGSVDNSLVRSFERLLRKLLQFRRTPAVVLMEFLATDVRVSKLPFYATGEDQYGVLAQYYSIPWLSYRDAVWHEYMADVPGFRRYEIFPMEEERHPTPLGHRYMADMAIHLIQQTFFDSLMYPLETHQLSTQIPPPMFTGNWESSNLICVVGEQLPHTVVQNKGWEWINEGSAVKPKWGFVTWQVGATLVLKVDTRASAGRPEEQSAALEMQTPPAQQSQPKSRPKSKPTTTSPEPSVVSGPPAAQAITGVEGPADGGGTQNPDMIVWVGYVKSWRHMGTASFNCVQGCECQGTTVDALHDLGNTQQHMVKLYTTQAKDCLVEVRVNPWSRNKEHKFKVTAIMVTHAVEYSGHGDFTDTVLLDNISPTHSDEKHQEPQG